MEKLNVNILSPYGKYLTTKVDKINVYSEDFNLGISPGHSPFISSLVISKMILENDGEEKIYAIGGGVIVIKNGGVKLLLDSIESKDEIDLKLKTKRLYENMKEMRWYY